MPGHGHIIVEGARPGEKVAEDYYLVMCLPVLLEVHSVEVIEPLNCFQAWGPIGFSTKKAWDKTNVCFDLGLTLKPRSGAVGLPLSVCFVDGLVCFFSR